MPETDIGLENALRDAATRAMKPEMPLMLALAFFRSVTGLMRSLRQYRIAAELPITLSAELRTMLESVLASAIRRLEDPNLPDVQALRVLRSIEALSRGIILTMPVAPKAKKPKAKPATMTPASRAELADKFAAMTARTLEMAGQVNPALADALRKTLPDIILSRLPESPVAAPHPAASPSATR